MIDNRKMIAIVPIKEHSERVKGKNFKLFRGKPLYHNILDTLQAVNEIDEIVIDTDSNLVAQEATRLYSKVKIVRRLPELCGDMVSVNKILAYDLSQTDGEIYLQTHATNPLLKVETISNALKTFIKSESEHDSIFSVNRFQSRFYNYAGKAINHNPNELLRTQDLPPIYEENSNFYIFTKTSFAKTNARIGQKPLLFEISRFESVDIDDEFSFKLAEIVGEHIQQL